MINCEEAVRQLWDYLENDLDEQDRARLEEHLSFCRTCCGEVTFADELRTVLHTAARPLLPAEVAENLGRYIDDLEDTKT